MLACPFIKELSRFLFLAAVEFMPSSVLRHFNGLELPHVRFWDRSGGRGAEQRRLSTCRHGHDKQQFVCSVPRLLEHPELDPKC